MIDMMSCQKELDEMFTGLVLYMYQNLEHFGEILMVDRKAIQSFGTKPEGFSNRWRETVINRKAV